MLPEMSTQKMTRDSSFPVSPLDAVEGAGSNMKVTSLMRGISSSSISNSLSVPQNSQCQIYKINHNSKYQYQNVYCSCKIFNKI